jgi:hypothetical protein
MRTKAASKTITRDLNWLGPAIPPGEILLEEYLKRLEIPAFSLVGHSVYRVTGVSNPASGDFYTRNRSRFAAVAVRHAADSSRQIATLVAVRE